MLVIHLPFVIRLDEKIPPYDLIWDDDQMLAGKVSSQSFPMSLSFTRLAVNLIL